MNLQIGKKWIPLSLLLCIVLLTTAGLSASSAMDSGISMPFGQADSITNAAGAKTPEEAMRTFISAMTCADRAGLADRHVRNICLIESAFGADCWDSAEFAETDGPALITREAYILSATGEEITLQEYERLRDEHIARVCSRHSFSPADLSLQGAALETLTPEEMTAYITVGNEISETIPVQMVGKSAAPYVHYRLTFNGKSASEKGMICDVEADFIQIDGMWRFHSIWYSALGIEEDDV